MLDGEFSSHRYVDTLAGNLDIEAVAVFNGVSQTTQLCDEVSLGITFLDIAFLFVTLSVRIKEFQYLHIYNHQ